ncbi:MAG TPA: type 1 glutamine amidotransferase domain-containing protein [Actinomycetota bacterium]|nr:type 1 glutamine amidotransferase domain-containing protein [Actinomycetota bacterium]
MTLEGKRILLFAGPMFEDMELLYPLYRLREEGAEVVVAGLGDSSYEGKKGHPVECDVHVNDVSADDFDAVVVPGGYLPDHLRRSQKVLEITREADEAGKPVAAICHAAWVPISAGIARGRRMTSYWSIRDDVSNAGAQWVDEEVVVDGNLITSRYPADLPAFCRALIDRLATERRQRGAA